MSQIDVVIGLQRGDEGKGRFVDLMAKDYQVIARGNGGANAGHTVVPEGVEPIALHQIPSGIAYPGKLNIIGNGIYLDPVRMKSEMQDVRGHGLELSQANLAISDVAHLVLPHHVMLDSQRESGKGAQGSTKSGIAFVASEKYLREGVRTEKLLTNLHQVKKRVVEGIEAVDPKLSQSEVERVTKEWLDAAEALLPYVTDTIDLLAQKMADGAKVLAEGAQAHWLDINHGMYPAVTSSSTTVSGLLDGIGASPRHLGKVTGVAKLIKSHVGGGPFVTEILDEELSASIRGEVGKVDSEYGATTKRPRRIGHFDLVELKNAVELNGVSELAISKMDQADRYGDEIKIAVEYECEDKVLKRAPSSAEKLANCTAKYESLPSWAGISNMRAAAELPDEVSRFVEKVENHLGVRVTRLGVGPEREQVINL